MDFVDKLLDTSDFPARWTCGQWTELHGWTHVLSDVAIFGAYTAIPFVIAYFTFRRPDYAHRPVFWLFCAFIFACGTTHLIEASLFWQPWYRLSAAAKVVTALVSWGAVLGLLRVAPMAARLPSLRQLTAIVESSEDAILGKDLQGRITSWNPGAERLYGWSAAEMVGAPLARLVPEDRRDELQRIMERVRRGERVPPFETVRVRKDGVEVDVSLSITPVRDGRGRVVGASAVARDIGSMKRVEAELLALSARLEEQASEDPLTGLVNRRGLEQQLTRELGRARREGSSVVAILVDLDDFKQVNDRLGHSAGDELLRGAAERMAACVRPGDVLARVGGDEFLVLLPGTRLAEGRHVAERLRLAIADAPLELSGGSARVTASLGLANVPDDTLSIEQLLDLTRHGLARGKQGGKNRVALADAPLGGAADDDAAPADELERLLRAESLTVLWQPLCELAGGAVVGHELLVRGPDGPYHHPRELFRASTERNLLTAVDLLCFRTCVERAARLSDGRLHVNLVPATLLDTPVAGLIDLMEKAGGARRFCVELSEQQFLGDPSSLREPLAELRAAGAQLALDDVGFGRSSLEALVLLEPDVIKIDRRFVHGAADDAGARRRLQRLVRAAGTLEGRLVAEGLEREADRELLLELGVGVAQGYLLGAPGPLPEG